MTQVRVRFAPSPTGDLHMGGARTALFNWLFARHHGGAFILRIEDTDRERSTPEAVAGILEGLNWLGLDWDEGPVYQSQRTELYTAAIEELLENGSAYYDFSDPEKIQADRKAAQKQGKSYRYDRHGMEADLDKARDRIAGGEVAAVRLKIPAGSTSFEDKVAGSVTFRHENIEDFVLARGDGSPTYMLSVVVDDIDLGITHVIRGNDHIANTPKQILLYQALNKPVPEFAHLPLIHGPDKKKLSKRHGGTTVGEYMGKGYLPAAMLNFLALLGWSPGEDREVLSIEQMIELFELERVNKSAAVFDVEKLGWINASAIAAASADSLLPFLAGGLKERGLWNDTMMADPRTRQIIDLVKERTRLTTDLAGNALFFYTEPREYDETAVKKRCKGENLHSHVRELASDLSQLEQWRAENIENCLRGRAEVLELGAGKLIHPLRIGITGLGVTPDVFTIAELLGKETVINRLQRFAAYLEDRG